jgi:hypothetical protein
MTAISYKHVFATSTSRTDTEPYLGFGVTNMAEPPCEVWSIAVPQDPAGQGVDMPSAIELAELRSLAQRLPTGERLQKLVARYSRPPAGVNVDAIKKPPF